MTALLLRTDLWVQKTLAVAVAAFCFCLWLSVQPVPLLAVEALPQWVPIVGAGLSVGALLISLLYKRR